MDRRRLRIVFILILTALTVGVLPVIPVGEVLAPEHSGPQLASSTTSTVPSAIAVSPVAYASTLEKLRHLFSR